MSDTNPFTRIKEALRAYIDAHWDALGDDNPAKVKIGNRWRRKRSAVLSADLPEVDVRPLPGGENKPFSTSKTALFTRIYEFGIATDATQDDAGPLDQAEWELIRVAIKAHNEKLGIEGLVVKVAIELTRQTLEDQELDRGKRRWTGAVALAVTFQVPASELYP